MKVIDYYTKEVLRESDSKKELETFIFDFVKPLSDGRKIYRVIKQPDGDVYDVGEYLLQLIVDKK